MSPDAGRTKQQQLLEKKSVLGTRIEFIKLMCLANDLPYNDYFEYFGPDFKLHIQPK